MMGFAAVDNLVLDFLEDLSAAESVDAAWEKTVRYFRGQGASHVGNLLDRNDSGIFHLTTTTRRVMEIYHQYVYPDHDPKREHCRKNLTPYFFGQEFWDREPNLSKPRRWCDEELVGEGGRAMFAVPMHMSDSKLCGHVSVATDLDRDEFCNFYKNHGGRLHMAAIISFNHIFDLVKNENASRIGLTDRESEALLWLAKGFLADRIAEKMKIKTITVSFHLANARRKLNAKTSAQALMKALQLGLIQP